MGASASRAVAKTASEAAPAQQAAAEASAAAVAAQQALEHLPADSAVRKDAARATQYKEWRAAQEQGLDGVQLEEQSARDPGLNDMMHQTMQREEGQIQYREHLLPMQESPFAQTLVQEMRTPRDHRRPNKLVYATRA